MTQYYEDVTLGETTSTGTYEVSEDDIVDFATEFDPQPIHTDPDAAAESMFGGLVASGWHTASITMRLLVEDVFPGTGALGAVGVDDLRFPAPMRPGDVLSARSEVVEKEAWDDDRGLVHAAVETSADERTVLTMTGLVLWERT